MPGFGYDNILSYDYDNLRYHLGNGLEVSNIYPFTTRRPLRMVCD